MITAHHLGISQSERVVWLCEELSIAYALRRYDRDPTTRLAPAEYKALHPMGIAPVITDGDLVLAESGAIQRRKTRNLLLQIVAQLGSRQEKILIRFAAVHRILVRDHDQSDVLARC
jgi:hypothetical protein